MDQLHTPAERQTAVEHEADSALTPALDVEGSRTGSTAAGTSDVAVRKAVKISVWPLFTDADIKTEKWHIPGKRRGKARLFEDPDNSVELLPPSLASRSVMWKRPFEFLGDETPMVVDVDEEKEHLQVDLVTHNVHLLVSELMRWIVCQVDMLWQLHNKHGFPGKVKEDWKPWDLIYPKSKSESLPVYNASGKYCVKLFWMGQWRKILIDDQMPFDGNQRMLLPVTEPHELWFPLLTKALLKVASLTFRKEANSGCEGSDNSFVYMLTGWVPEEIPLRSNLKKPVWMLIKKHLPEWNPDNPGDNHVTENDAAHNEDVAEVLSQDLPENYKKESLPENYKKENYPVVVFASYCGRSEQTLSSSVPEQDSVSVSLRKLGLSPDLPHVVMVTQTRRQPLWRPRPPNPDSLVNRFAYQGFKSRRKREAEAKKIAEELKFANYQIIEVMSPLMNLQAVTEFDNSDLLTSCAKAPPLDTMLASECPEEQSEPRETRKWLEYDEFVNCFTTLHVLHKPGGYKYKRAVQDMKKLNQTVGRKIDKSSVNKQELAAAGDFAPFHPIAHELGPNGTQSSLLCVDSTKDIEIVITLSTIPHWPYLGVPKKEHPLVRKRRSTVVKKNDNVTNLEAYMDIQSEEEVHKHNQSALLIAEEYHWDTVVAGQPLLKIRTKGVKATALTLPAGRHLVQLNVSARIGFILELWSESEFIFQEEDEVLHELTKESLRYRNHAMAVLSTVAAVVEMFDDIPTYREAFYGQGVSHKEIGITVYHCKLLYSSLVDTLVECLGESLTADLAFAWKAFAQEGLRVFLQGLEKDIPKLGSQAGNLKFINLNFSGKRRKEGPVPDNWINRVSTDWEQRAATKIQACFRGYWQHKIWRTVTQDTPQHKKACELLSNCLEVVVAHAELVAMTLFQTMFRKDPQLLKKFPFKDDEWSRVCFEDHIGNYEEQPANSVFLMFRETFYVQHHGVLVVPRLYTSVLTHSLRVLNNDTGEEIPRVFQRVSPHIYTKNKRGYTFVAEGRAKDEAIPQGKCRLRLIGTEPTLLRPKHKGRVSCEFSTKVLTEYYLPNRDYEFIRYRVTVQEDMVITVRVATSKESAYIKLQILDTVDGVEQEMMSASGKGHAVIPAFLFLKDRIRCESVMSYFPDTPAPECPEDENNTVEISRRKSRAQAIQAKRRKDTCFVMPSLQEIENEYFPDDRPAENAASKDNGDHQHCSAENIAEDKDNGDNEIQPADTEGDGGLEEHNFSPKEGYVAHKYIIRAVVERGSWNEKESAWEQYSLEQAIKHKPVTSMKRKKSGRQSVARCYQLASALNVPHWTLKIVTSEEQKDSLKIEKDTEKDEQVKAVKAALKAKREKDKPGSTAKAQMAREAFLRKWGFEAKEMVVKTGASSFPAPTDKDGPPCQAISLNQFHVDGHDSSPAKQGTSKDLSPFHTHLPILQRDFSQFVRKCSIGVQPKLLDKTEIKRRTEKKMKEIDQFRSFKQLVLDTRELDRKKRQTAKRIQLEVAEERQEAVEKARDRWNQLRKVCCFKQMGEEELPELPKQLPERLHKRTKNNSRQRPYKS